MARWHNLVLLGAFLLPLSNCQAQSDFAYEQGAIVRGDTNRQQIALVFTGDEYADGALHIIDVLDSLAVRASFFFTGRFYRNPEFETYIETLRDHGHYLGAHSDRHLLYCMWENRDSLLVTRDEFEKDVRDNYMEMNKFGIKDDQARYFLPPYEWYNDRISEWTTDLGLQLVNYTPGTRSHADYTTPGMDNGYVASNAIVESILSHEKSDRNGLNGFILLVHVGTHPERTDKFYFHLGSLLSELSTRGYEFVRIDQLLAD